MKKKIFTLLTLLIGAVSSSWGITYDRTFTSNDASTIKSSKTNTWETGDTWTVDNEGNGTASTYVKYTNKDITVTITGHGMEGKISEIVIINYCNTAPTEETITAYISDGSTETMIGSVLCSKKTSSAGSSTIDLSSTKPVITKTDKLILKVTNVVSKNNSFYLGGAKVTYLAPTITSQPVGGSYLSGDPITALTVVATASDGDLSYQWYTCDDAGKTNASPISGATNSSYTPEVSGFYFCRVTDSNYSVDTDVAEIVISAATAPTITIDASDNSVTAGTSITLTATTTGVPAPTLQWYVNDANNTTTGTPVTGETGETYTFDAVAGTKYYYAIATNASGSVASNVETITATARTGHTLRQVIYSNSFDAFITEPTAAVLYEAEDDEVVAGTANVGDVKTPAANGTIKAYYLAGTSTPTLTSTLQSDGAVVNTATAGKITVTAEDGVGSSIYDITIESVSPFDGSSKVFDGTETWVKTGNAFSTSSGKEGWVFSKNDTDWSRESPGKNRIYFFLAPSTSVTFANGGTARNIKVYKNGVELGTPTSSSSCTIEGDTENAYMIAVVSNQTSGDGALKSITVEGASTETLTPAKTYTTLTSAKALDFTSVSADLKAYIIKDTDASDGITLTQVNKVPAGTGMVLEATTPGTAVNVPVLTGASDDVTGNKMEGSATATTAISENGGYILSDGKFHPASAGDLPAGKAYLNITVTISSPEMIFGETTAIENLTPDLSLGERVQSVYNLSGQRVAQPTKGLYIVNGRKVVMK